MTTLAEVLEKYAPEISEADFAENLQAKMAHVTGAEDAPLTAGEAGFLAEHGGAIARSVLEGWDPIAERRRRTRISADSVQNVLAHTLSAEQTAQLIDKSRSQVSRDLTAGRLYGLRVGRHWRIPRWQFADRHALPGLDVVVPRIPHQLHPSVVEGFMSTPQDDLGSMTPVAHLASGGDPTPVAEMVAELGRT